MVERRPFDALGGATMAGSRRNIISPFRYYDPDRVGHGALRVLNNDEIAPNTRFPPHPHADMGSSPMCGRARSRMRTASAIKDAPRRATCR